MTRKVHVPIRLKRQIAESQAEARAKGTRQWMLQEIKENMADFHGWYDKVYQLRTTGQAAEYENTIAAKYNELYPVVATPTNYNQKRVPDITCPKCGGLLIVRERRLRQRGLPDYVTNFVGCTAFETRGCSYTGKFTDEIKLAIDSVVYDEEPEF